MYQTKASRSRTAFPLIKGREIVCLSNLIYYRYGLQSKGFALPLISIAIIFILVVLLVSYSLFCNAFAASPAFDQIFLTDAQVGKNDWVQTYGNDSTHLKSDYTNILAVDYVSDGKNLNATLWLKSNLENASTYSQPFKKI
jgi:hypothetical protein